MTNTITTDFQTAVKMLHDGEASKIEQTIDFMGSIEPRDLDNGTISVRRILKPWSVHLIPKYDEVEVVRWECEACSQMTLDTAPDRCECGSNKFFKLVGVRQIPRKRKVMREKTLGTAIEHFIKGERIEMKIPAEATIVARWEEEVE